MALGRKNKYRIVIAAFIVVLFIISELFSGTGSEEFTKTVRKFDNAEIKGKITHTKFMDRGYVFTVSGEEYWFSPGSRDNNFKRVTINDSIYKKSKGDTLYIYKSNSNKMMFFTFAKWRSILDASDD